MTVPTSRCGRNTDIEPVVGSLSVGWTPDYHYHVCDMATLSQSLPAWTVALHPAVSVDLFSWKEGMSSYAASTKALVSVLTGT